MPREVQERGGFLGFMSDLIHLRPQYQPPQLTVPLELRQVGAGRAASSNDSVAATHRDLKSISNTAQVMCLGYFI